MKGGDFTQYQLLGFGLTLGLLLCAEAVKETICS